MQEIEARVTEDGVRIGRGRSNGNGPADLEVDFPVNGADDHEPLRDLVRRLLVRNQQLERALDSRIVIEQAKGVLAERFSLAPDDAFQILRRAARNRRMKIHALAAEIVQSRSTPQAVAEVLDP